MLSENSGEADAFTPVQIQGTEDEETPQESHP